MGVGLMRGFPFIDYAFSGEADVIFPRFAESVLNGIRPPAYNGVIARDPTTGDVMVPPTWVSPVDVLDNLPYPDFDDYFKQIYQTRVMC
jgi:hypothetical protein